MAHHHNHDDGESMLELNKKQFNSEATTYEQIHAFQYMNKECCNVILDTIDPLTPDLPTLDVMEYACGPGMLSTYMLDSSKRPLKVTGVDISQGMVDRFNQRAREAGYPKETCQAVVSNGSDLSELNGAKFDLIVCVHAYHHIQDLEAATSLLASALKQGGYLIVLDFLATKDIQAHFATKTHVAHPKGLSPEDLQSLFEKVLINVKAKPSHQVSKEALLKMPGNERFERLLSQGTDSDIKYVMGIGQKA